MSSVAVIGLGIGGLTATKNLVEAGFQVTAHDPAPKIGGLWAYSEDPTKLTVIKSTRTNLSRHTSSLTDFPIPEGFAPDEGSRLPARYIQEYFEAYVDHFDLRSSVNLEHAVKHVSPLDAEDPDTRWKVSVENVKTGQVVDTEVDRVVLATGSYQIPRQPIIDGLKDHPTMVTHGHAYKSPDTYKDQRVIVVGTGNTAVDIASELVGSAAQVYWSGRSGSRIFKPTDPPIDASFTRRRLYQSAAAAREGGGKAEAASAETIKKLDDLFRSQNPDVDLEALGLLPAPPMERGGGGVNGQFVPLLASGKIQTIGQIKRVEQGRVRTVSGHVIECDHIITATGGRFPFEVLEDGVNPTLHDHELLDAAEFGEALRIPRLFQGIFHPRFPRTLAVTGATQSINIFAFANFDLVGMAIAQVMAGNHLLPSRADMELWCDEMYRFNVEEAKIHRLPRVRLKPYDLDWFLHAAAGTGVNEMIGRGEEGSPLWEQDRELWDLIMDGMPNSYFYRLFDGRSGGRKKWANARQAILWANRQASPPEV